MRVHPVVAPTLGISSLVLFGLGIYFYAQARHLQKVGVRTQATVVRIVENSSGDRILYYPALSFHVEGQKQVEVVYSRGSNPAGYKVGDTTPVLYDPADPSKVRINSPGDLWTLPAVMVGGGILDLALCVLFFWCASRRPTAPQPSAPRPPAL